MKTWDDKHTTIYHPAKKSEQWKCTHVQVVSAVDEHLPSLFRDSELESRKLLSFLFNLVTNGSSTGVHNWNNLSSTRGRDLSIPTTWLWRLSWSAITFHLLDCIWLSTPRLGKLPASVSATPTDRVWDNVLLFVGVGHYSHVVTHTTEQRLYHSWNACITTSYTACISRTLMCTHLKQFPSENWSISGGIKVKGAPFKRFLLSVRQTTSSFNSQSRGMNQEGGSWRALQSCFSCHWSNPRWPCLWSARTSC